MKKILPSMMLSFTLYSADPILEGAKQGKVVLSQAGGLTQKVEDIRKKKGFVTSDIELIRENVAFTRSIVGAIVAGYVLLEDVNTRDILLGAALCGLAVQQIQIFGLVNALKQNKCERDALKQEQDDLKKETRWFKAGFMYMLQHKNKAIESTRSKIRSLGRSAFPNSSNKRFADSSYIKSSEKLITA